MPLPGVREPQGCFDEQLVVAAPTKTIGVFVALAV